MTDVTSGLSDPPQHSAHDAPGHGVEKLVVDEAKVWAWSIFWIDIRGATLGPYVSVKQSSGCRSRYA